MGQKKISHVLNVLTEITSLYFTEGENLSIEKIRVKANEKVGKKAGVTTSTINEACCRKLDLKSLADFHRLVENWLFEDDNSLEILLTKKTPHQDDRQKIHDFFLDFRESNKSKLPVIKTEEKDNRYSPISTQDYHKKTSFSEGKEIPKIHTDRERDSRVSKLAKEIRFNDDKFLRCDVCGFSFVEVYGELGKGFIEAHHVIPISSMNEGQETDIKDIALICSNCHSMIHRYEPWLKIDELKKRLQK